MSQRAEPKRGLPAPPSAGMPCLASWAGRRRTHSSAGAEAGVSDGNAEVGPSRRTRDKTSAHPLPRHAARRRAGPASALRRGRTCVGARLDARRSSLEVRASLEVRGNERCRLRHRVRHAHRAISGLVPELLDPPAIHLVAATASVVLAVLPRCSTPALRPRSARRGGVGEPPDVLRSVDLLRGAPPFWARLRASERAGSRDRERRPDPGKDAARALYEDDPRHVCPIPIVAILGDSLIAVFAPHPSSA